MSTSKELLISVLTTLGLGENAYLKPNENGIKAFHGRMERFFPKTETKLEITRPNVFTVIGEDFSIVYVIDGEHVKHCTIM